MKNALYAERKLMDFLDFLSCLLMFFFVQKLFICDLDVHEWVSEKMKMT